jgi:hypothetical protein
MQAKKCMLYGMYENEEMTAKTGGNFVLPPTGNQVAKCVGIVMLGTIDSTYEGHVKRVPTVRISFELLRTNHVFVEGEAPQPFIVNKEFTFSMNKKAGLRKMLDAWRGTAMTDEEARKFNIVKLIGADCLANIIKKTSGKGTEYIDIATISQIPAGTEVPAQRTESFLFNYNLPFKTDVYKKLPEYIQKKIQSSDEYIALSKDSQPQVEDSVQASLPKATGTKKDTTPF